MAEVRPTDVAVEVKKDKGDQDASGDENIKEYNPELKPADLEMAVNHGKAKRVYKNPKINKNEEEEESPKDVCPCCTLPIEGELIGLCEPTSSFYHIGVGYALYFDFIKYSIYLLVLLFAVSGLYNLVTNIVAGDCTVTNLTCLGDYISIMAIQNKFNHPELIEGQLIVNLISVILMMLYFHYIRFRFRKASIKADDITITPSDYTIRLKNLPIDVSNDDLKNWILELGDDNNTLEIRKINRAFQILEYLEAKQKLTGLQNKVKKASVKNKPILGKQIDELNEYLKKFKAEKDFTVTKTAFVTFKTAAQADFVKKQFQKSLLRQLIDFLTPFLKSKTRLNGTRVDVVRAPEPTDVVWPNLCYKTKTIIKWRIFTAFMTLVLIGASFGLIIGINKLQQEVANSSDAKSTRVQFLSILASIVITIINTSLTMSIRWLAKNEKHGTATDYYAAVAGKLTIAQFINTALMNLLAKLVLADGGISAGLNSINFYNQGGLITNMYYVFITNAILGPVLTILNPGNLMKKMKQKKILKQGKENALTQEQAHQLFEGVVVDISAKYAALSKTLLLTFFYASGMPMAIVYTIFGLFLLYWSEKYSLLRMQQLPGAMSDDLSFSMLEYIDYGPLLFALGNLVFARTLKNNADTLVFYNQSYQLIYIAIIISLGHIIFPMTYINEVVFKIKDEVTETLIFDKARMKFLTDYDIENPITKKKAQAAFLRMVAKYQKRQQERRATKDAKAKEEKVRRETEKARRETEKEKKGEINGEIKKEEKKEEKIEQKNEAQNLNETVVPLKEEEKKTEKLKSEENQNLESQQALNKSEEQQEPSDKYDTDNDDSFFDDKNNQDDDDQDDYSIDLGEIEKAANTDKMDAGRRESQAVQAKRLEEEMRKEKEKILINFDASKFGSTIRNEEIVHHEVDAGYEDMGVSAKKETTKRYASEQTAIPINFESKPFQSILPENIGQIEAKLADSSFISDIDVTDNKIEPTILSRKNSQKLDTQFEKNADNDHEMNDVSPIKHTDQTQDQLIKHSEKNETKVDEDKKEKSEVSHNKANFE